MSVNGDAEETLYGSTAFVVLVVAPVPPVMEAPPEVYIAAVPFTLPLTLNELTVIDPDGETELESVVPAAEGLGCAVVTRIDPPGQVMQETLSAPVESAPAEDR